MTFTDGAAWVWNLAGGRFAAVAAPSAFSLLFSLPCFEIEVDNHSAAVDIKFSQCLRPF
jgi:hypothetical protein